MWGSPPTVTLTLTLGFQSGAPHLLGGIHVHKVILLQDGLAVRGRGFGWDDHHRADVFRQRRGSQEVGWVLKTEDTPPNRVTRQACPSLRSKSAQDPQLLWRGWECLPLAAEGSE